MNSPSAPRPSLQDHVLVTCEHAGNHIPAAYRPLFAPLDELLQTHRGYDAGALALARDMARSLDAPLLYSTTSRLLVDLNRSVGHPRLHVPAVRALPPAERRAIVERHWRPHRQAVEGHVAAAVAAGQRVVHIASHSFTPELDGEVRNADIGILYDPSRPGEVALARLWMRQLREGAPSLRVRLNYPYAGRGDGLTTSLRKAHGPEQYVGLESELNQSHVARGGSALRKLRAIVVQALQAALDEFAES